VAKNKETKFEDMADVQLAQELKGSLDMVAERGFWVKARAKVEAGKLSVRGLKATIQLVEETGSAPTIRSTWAQYFGSAFIVEDLAGGKEETLKEIFSVTIQGCRKSKGKGAFEELAKGSKSFAELARKVANLPDANNGESDKSLDALVARFLKGMEKLENIKVGDVDQWLTFCKTVEGINKAQRANNQAQRANHPVVAVRKSA
jgi:hypothetical protein